MFLRTDTEWPGYQGGCPNTSWLIYSLECEEWYGVLCDDCWF